jgi:hypothetical protein
MFRLIDKINDPLNGFVGQHIKKIQSISKWTKEKHLARMNLISFLEKNNYISFSGHLDKYHLSCVGESCLYDVPSNRRGHLKVFRGKRIRLVCVWSGRYERLYMAGIL